ncbi:glycosyl transferase family protein [Roseomonas indoligenes]|uniref:Glycosyl transferase family protein n=1 Tax=Roseomonas indoligenes TaxID=2820811 RepID=A0A940MYY1_9PROT|nr:glycosyl transferase family protein [Pararoseomonas indoligenes]MBP0491242.1 glycosyl transferase family protein [Pararoseomonas indoligenes]
MQPDGAGPASDEAEPEHPFAPFIRTLGRGPGRSRALTREEAREALRMVLAGAAEPIQVGAFLMLLRYRGEDPEELTGLVEAAREAVGAGPAMDGGGVELDWPSYGSGRTRGAPWFLLAALALARAGHRVLMHGSNAFTSGMPVLEALPLLGLRAVRCRAEALEAVGVSNFAYLPLRAMSPRLDELLHLRSFLGLRSPINTVARLINPANAPAGVDGVFHPPYIAAHLAVAQRMARPRLLVVKGGGGEAERGPAKPVAAHLMAGPEVEVLSLPALRETRAAASDFLGVWQGRVRDAHAEGTVIGTISLGLLAMGRAATPGAADARAAEIWHGRFG